MKQIAVNILLVSLLFSQALWDTEDGVALRQGVHIEWYRTIAPGDNQSVIMVWSDTRHGSRNVFAQKISPDGDYLWGPDGVTVTMLPGRQEDPVAITDGDGGLFIAWVDYRFDEDGDIFVQHVNGDGDLELAAEGQALCQQPGMQKTIAMCTDSLGGVFVTWQDERNGVDQDIYGTHITTDNSVLQAGTGIPVIQMNGDQDSKSIEYAGNNEALVVWADKRDGENVDIFAQRLTTDMDLLFDSDGLGVATQMILESFPRTTYMHGDTSLVAWTEGESQSDVIYQMINGSGLIGNPMPVSSFVSTKSAARLKPGKLGHVFITWKDLRSDTVDGDMFAQRIDPDGSIGWDTDGIQLELTEYKNANVRFSSDGNGGAFFLWERGEYPDVDIAMQHISADGFSSLPGEEPILISSATKYQFSPVTLAVDTTMAYVVYADEQSGSVDLRIQQVDQNGITAFSGTGLKLIDGLDGDVNYVNAFTYDDSVGVLWEDNRSGKLIYGLGIDGITGDYGLNGVNATENPGVSDNVINEPEVVEAGEGYDIATFDGSTGSKLVHLIRVNRSFEPLWDSSRVVFDFAVDQSQAQLLSLTDGSVGVLLSEIRSEISFDIFYQRYDMNGNTQLPAEGVTLADELFTDEYVHWVTLTPDDNMLVFWEEDDWPAGVLKYQVFTTDGVPVTEWPMAITLDGPTGDPGLLHGAVINDTSGVFVVWESTRNGHKDIYGQIINWDGTQIWEANGHPLTDAPNDQTNARLAIDSVTTDAMVVWEDFRDGMDFDIYGQYVNLSEAILPDTNMIICDGLDFQLNPTVVSFGNRRFWTVWEDNRGIEEPEPVVAGGTDLYMNSVINGELVYPSSGEPFITEYHDQKTPKVTPLNDLEYLAAWVDLRSSGKADLANLYATVVSSEDVMSVGDSRPPVWPESFSVKSAYPNPFNGRVTIKVDIPALHPVRWSIFNLLGQKVYDQVNLPSRTGEMILHWDGRNLQGNPLGSGVYFYQIRYDGLIESGSMTYLK